MKRKPGILITNLIKRGILPKEACPYLVKVYEEARPYLTKLDYNREKVLHCDALADYPELLPARQWLYWLNRKTLEIIKAHYRIKRRVYRESSFISRQSVGLGVRRHSDSEKLENGKWLPNHTYWRSHSGLLYLNEDFEGGEICFPNQGIKHHPRIGDLVAFETGRDYEHEVTPVLSGEPRYAILMWYTLDKKRGLMENAIQSQAHSG